MAAIELLGEFVSFVKAVVADCEDTFYDPEEMSDEWVELYRWAKTLLAKANEEFEL